MTNDDTTSSLPHEPDLNGLAALSEGRCSETERERRIEHLSNCRDCREIYAGLAGLSESAASERRSSWKWIGLAASLAVAAVLGYRVATISREAPVRVPSPAAAPTAAPGIATVAPLAVTKAETEPPPPAPDAHRGGQRRVGAKSFRLVAGEWRDESYDATADLPIVEASTPSARAQLLAARPGLGPYAALGDRVLVVFEGSVYRLGPPAR